MKKVGIIAVILAALTFGALNYQLMPGAQRNTNYI
jgi:hypothetical protein